jgi:putative ABC transport system permease protein
MGISCQSLVTFAQQGGVQMRKLRAWIIRLSSLFVKPRHEREMSEEFESHLQMHIEDNVQAGMTPEEARRQAMIKLGGIEQTKESYRDRQGIPLVEILMQDLRYGLRMLQKNPGFTAVALATLALGIGANTAMFSIIHAALMKPLPFRDPARLVFASTTFGGTRNPMTSAPDYYDYREQAGCFDGFSAMLAMAPKTTVTGGAEPERAAFTYVAHDFFQTLGVVPVAGRVFRPEDGQPGAPNVVVVGEHFAQRRFGAARQAVGASLNLDGRPYTVVGVMPAAFHFIHDVDIWAPMQRGESWAAAPRQFHNWLIVARLKPRVSIQSAQRQVDVISKRLEQQYPASDATVGLRLDPLQAALAGPEAPRLLLLMAAVGLVLLIACANVAGLLLARGSVRRQELAMRAALGASRARIAGQLLTESVTLALLAGVLGVALAFWLNGLLPLVTGLSNSVNTFTGLEWPVLLFALAISILAGVLFGIAPAWRTSALNLAEDLAPGARTTATKGGKSLRNALVVGQVAVSLVLLIGAGLLIRSLAQLAGTSPGFDAHHLLTGEIQLLDSQYYDPGQRIRFFDGLHVDFAAVPGVNAAGFISELPIRNPLNNYPAWNTEHPPADLADQLKAHKRIVLPGYFDAVRIPLLAGRDLGKIDSRNAPLAMVINQKMARDLFTETNPLGQRVSADLGGPKPTTFEVVGVVGDARIEAIGLEAPMTMYLSYYQFPNLTLRFAIRTDLAPESITRTVRRLVAARNRDIPVENLVSMEEIIGDSLASQQVTAVALALFAMVALLLACLGLYGVLAYSVSQRTHEIGIRMALGANRREVLRLVLKQGMTLALGGIAVGTVAAFGLTRLFKNMLYGIAPDDPATFVAVLAILTMVAALACAIPARRAAKVDPMEALRYE